MVKKSLLLGLLTTLISTTIMATPSIEVYTKCEGLHETNISKTRIYVQNIGDEVVSDFKLRYYFTEENGYPVGEFWYIPVSTGSVVQVDETNYYVELDYSGYDLEVGTTTPYIDGNVFGIHLPSWASIDKNDDFSFVNSSEFVLNENIAIFDAAGNHIYGNVPTEFDEVKSYNVRAVTPMVGTALKMFLDPIENDKAGVLKIYSPDGYVNVLNLPQGITSILLHYASDLVGAIRIELYVDGVLTDETSTYYVGY